MRKKREFVEGAAYHGASRTNDRKRVFERNAGRKTMPLVIRDAKNNFGFTPANFCIMPAHTPAHHTLQKGKPFANYALDQDPFGQTLEPHAWPHGPSMGGGGGISPVSLKTCGTIFS
ncbi:MAG: hypothetical protein LBK66_07070 [Spirochaetaceae bacterium]|nr:hypothetical protein [Spirochaetaceae bacterium]